MRPLSYSILLLVCFLSSYPFSSINGNRIDSLIERAELQVFSNPKQSIQLTQQAIALMNLSQNAEKETKALLIRGISYKYLGEFDMSVKTLYEALGLCPERSHSLQADILIHLSNAYCRLRDYSKAFDINEQATSICKIYGDSITLAASYNNRGLIHYNLNEFDVSDIFFNVSVSALPFIFVSYRLFHTLFLYPSMRQ